MGGVGVHCVECCPAHRECMAVCMCRVGVECVWGGGRGGWEGATLDDVGATRAGGRVNDLKSRAPSTPYQHAPSTRQPIASTHLEDQGVEGTLQQPPPNHPDANPSHSHKLPIVIVSKQ